MLHLLASPVTMVCSLPTMAVYLGGGAHRYSLPAARLPPCRSLARNSQGPSMAASPLATNSAVLAKYSLKRWCRS